MGIRRRAGGSLLLGAAVLSLVGCSSESSPAASSSGPAPSGAVTQPGVSGTDSATDSTTPSDGSGAPTTVAAAPVYPLTGVAVADASVAARPAMVVKIDNNAKARPQSGLNEADIVFEEIVEVQTRFAAIFHSSTADPVGPIRSGRTQDIDLLGSFNRPLFVWSGGNPNVTAAIEGSDLRELSALKNAAYKGGGFYRDDQRKKPHNLYARGPMLFALAPPDAGPPPQQFVYLAPGDAYSGEPATSLAGDMDGLQVSWVFDAATGRYLRSSDGEPHLDALSGQVSTDNLIVMFVEYRPSVADARSPEAQTIGSGEAMVMRGGRLVRGTWSRADRFSPIVLTDAAGAPVKLTPGRTFIELARANTFAAAA